MSFQNGQRVRVLMPDTEYTGCRGTIADDPSTLNPGVTILGHMVAIDGENGVVRPFLVKHLVALRSVAVPAQSSSKKLAQPDVDPSVPR